MVSARIVTGLMLRPSHAPSGLSLSFIGLPIHLGEAGTDRTECAKNFFAADDSGAAAQGLNGMNDRRTFITLAGAAAASLLISRRSAALAPNPHFEINHTAAEWITILGPARYAVLRQAATEDAFSSRLLKEYRKGVFVCAGCALPLFSSATKFDSGTGWPSFYRALPNAIVTRPDFTHGMDRIEALCAKCGGHLGHVFDDGPKPTGLRYCINGLALEFRPASAA